MPQGLRVEADLGPAEARVTTVRVVATGLTRQTRTAAAPLDPDLRQALEQGDHASRRR